MCIIPIPTLLSGSFSSKKTTETKTFSPGDRCCFGSSLRCCVLQELGMGEADIVGYRFHPTDEELVNYYLWHKIQGNEDKVRSIAEVDIYKWEPWDLPKIAEESQIRSKDQLWYFFCPRGYKYNNSRRANRTTKAGFWKATGKDRIIKGRDTNQQNGTKKTLVYYKGRVPNGVRTSWVIHEYHRVSPTGQSAYVICKLKNKAGEKTCISSSDGGEPSCSPASDFQNDSLRTVNSEVGCQSEVNLEEFTDDPLSDPCLFDSDLALQSFIQQEECSLADLQFSDHFGNVQYEPPFQVCMTEEEEELDLDFVNSFLLTDQDESPREEIVHTRRHDYKQPMSYTGVHVENSSDTDTEMIYGRVKQYGKIPETSSLNNGPESSEFKQMRMEGGFHCDEILVTGAVPGETARAKHFEINCLELAMEGPSTNRKTCKSENQSMKFINCISQATPDTIQFQGKLRHEPALRNKARQASKQDTPVNLSKKKIFTKDAKKEQKKAEEAKDKGNIKLGNQGSAGGNKKGSFIVLETTQLSHKPSPPSVYLGNVLVGLVLFIIVIREAVFFH